MPRRTSGPLRRSLLYVTLVAIAALFLLPLGWMVTTSIKPVEQTLATPPTVLPRVTAAVVLEHLQAERAMAVLEAPGSAAAQAGLDEAIEHWRAVAADERALEETERAVMRLERLDGAPEQELAEARAAAETLRQRVEGELDRIPTLPTLAAIARDNYAGRTGPGGEVVVRGVLNDPVIDFMLYLRNTLVIVCLSTVGMVLSSAIVAYGFARVRWRGRGAVFTLVLATMMIPFPVLMGPLFVLFREVGWIGTFRPLWVPAWFGSAFNIFLLRQFYMGIPRDLDEAARIDGCSHWGIFWRIILPLSKPALAVVALFHFLFVWNDFLGPLIFLRDRDQFTLALGLQLYQSQAGNVPWNLLMAASTLVLLPVLAVFLLAQRSFVEGIAASGLKE